MADAAITFNEGEASTRTNLRESTTALRHEWNNLRTDLLAASAGLPGCTTESLRARANSLVLRATQAEARLRDLERLKSTIEAAYQPPAAVLLALGSALFRDGDVATATRYWEAAIGSDPKLGEAHNNLAAVYFQTGRSREAEAEIKSAEKAGFRVNPQLKEDVKKALAGR